MTARGSTSSLSPELLLVAFLWGATFTAGKAAVGDVPPLVVATLRFGLATLALLPVYAMERRGRPLLPRSAAAWRALLLLGLTAVVAYNALFFGGLALAPSSDSILLIPTTNPIWTALFAALILGERISARLRAGMLVALAGMALVLLGGPSASFSGERLAGNIMFVAAASVFGLSHVIGRIVTRHVSPLGATTLAGLTGSLLLLPAALLSGDARALFDAGVDFWLAMAFIAFGGTALAYVLWYRGVRSLGAGNTGVYTNLVPLVGLSLSGAFLDEWPTPLQVVGGAIMLVAVLWATRRAVPATPAPATQGLE